MKLIVTVVFLVLLTSMSPAIIPDRFSNPSPAGVNVLPRVVADNQTAPGTQPGSTTPATNGKLYPNAQPSSKRFQISLPPFKSANRTKAQTLGTNSWAIAAELSPGSNVPKQINGVEVVAYLPSIPSGLSGLQFWYSEVFTLFFPNGIAFQLAISAYGALTAGCTFGSCYVAQYDYSSTASTCSINSAPILGSGGTLSGGQYWALAVWWGGSSSPHWYYGIGYGSSPNGPFTIWQFNTLVSLQSVLSSADSYSYINAYSDGTCEATDIDQSFAAVESYDVTESDWSSLIGTIEFDRAINYYTGSGTPSWPSMTWATGAVWIGSQSYNQQDINGNYYDDFLGSISVPSWSYVAGCMQGVPSACTSGASGTYNIFSVGYSSSAGAIADPGATTSLLWALPPTASWSFSPSQARPSQSLTYSYTVTNPNGFDMYVGLGAYLRQTSNPTTVYVDPTHDTYVKASQCLSSCSRIFSLSGLSVGTYDVGVALWSGQPSVPPYVMLWGIFWQIGVLTIFMPTVTTDKLTYNQGDTIHYTGSGFTPNGQVYPCLTTNPSSATCITNQPNADSSGNVAGSFTIGLNWSTGSQQFWVYDVATNTNSNSIQLTILELTLTATQTTTATITSITSTLTSSTSMSSTTTSTTTTSTSTTVSGFTCVGTTTTTTSTSITPAVATSTTATTSTITTTSSTTSTYATTTVFTSTSTSTTVTTTTTSACTLSLTSTSTTATTSTTYPPRTVIFHTTPTTFVGATTPGSISACSGSFTDGQSTFCGATFSATANLPSPPTGWQFDHWTWSGGVTCTTIGNTASCSSSLSGGSLTAVYAAQVSFQTVPSSSALISWGSCGAPGEGNGQSIYSISYGSITACYVPSGYTLSSWSCSNGVTCSGSNDPTLVTFNGPGTITLNLKTGSLTNPISTSLIAFSTPSSMHGGTSFTVSGLLTANGGGVGGETIVLVFGWNENIVTVTTASDGSYTFTATAPSSVGSYNVQAFFLGDYTGNPSLQYLPSTATARITAN